MNCTLTFGENSNCLTLLFLNLWINIKNRFYEIFGSFSIRLGKTVKIRKKLTSLKYQLDQI